MSALGGIAEWLDRGLPDLLVRSGVPGAAVAVAAGDETIEAAAGLLSTATAVDATTDSLFQIGSITKTLTATLVLQLVDEGWIDLDRPVRTWLPELRLGHPEATTTITIRHLLSHVSGFEGDVFTDTGKGDDCLERYVALLGDLPQIFEPGAMFSYNNAGYCILGRLVEVLRGKPYDACLRDHLLAPLGLTDAATDPYEAVLHRVAVGHVPTGPGGALEPTRVWALARSNAPAGSMLAMRGRDLLGFARLHLAGGVGPDGSRVLSEAAVRAMQRSEVALPDIAQGAAWGLGWELFDVWDRPILGHDGNTIGQSAYLRLVPRNDVALVVLANGGNSRHVYEEVAGYVLRDLAGVEPSPPPTPAVSQPIAAADRYIGRYNSLVSETVVSQDGEGRLWLERTPAGVLAELEEPPYRTELVAWRGDSFVPVEPERGVHAPVAFVGDDGSGRATHIHTGRADRRAP